MNDLPVDSTHSPESTQELAELIQAATIHRRAIYPIGSTSRLRWGAFPEKRGDAVHLAGIFGIIEYQPEELTITVAAGTPISQLSAKLAEYGQWIPGLKGLPEDLQVGALLACPIPSPRDWRWGRFGDAVLGLDVVTGTGTLLRLGGRVVKNAAGYRLARLFLGSWGTLGVITQATLLTRPKPASIVARGVMLSRPALCEILPRELSRHPLPCLSEVILASQTVPIAALSHLASSSSTTNSAVQAVFLFEGDRQEVEQADEWLSQMAQAHNWEMSQTPVELEPWISSVICDNQRALFRAAGVPQKVPYIVAVIEKAFPACQWWGYLFAGLVMVADEASQMAPEQIIALRESLVRQGAELVILRMPPHARWPRSVIWGPPRPAHLYAQRWKDFCDPQNILNPGRFIFA